MPCQHLFTAHLQHGPRLWLPRNVLYEMCNICLGMFVIFAKHISLFTDDLRVANGKVNNDLEMLQKLSEFYHADFDDVRLVHADCVDGILDNLPCNNGIIDVSILESCSVSGCVPKRKQSLHCSCI